MSVFIKICGLRDAECVAAAVEAGGDAVGFVFADSLRKVSPAEAHAVSKDIPAGVKRVAVMHHPSNDEWQSVLQEFAPDVLQSDAGDFDTLDVPESITRWPVIRQGSTADVEMPRQVFVYEGTNSGAGEAVDWARAARIGDQGKMILAGGLAASNVAVAIKTARPWGVDVSSGVESSRGQKDVDLIRQFIVAVRAAEKD